MLLLNPAFTIQPRIITHLAWKAISLSTLPFPASPFNPRPSLTTLAASFFPSQDPLFFNQKNPTHSTQPPSPHSTQFQTLINQSKTPHSRSITPTESEYPTHLSSSSSSFYEFLVRRYKFSTCYHEAQQLHLQILKHGFGCDLFLMNTLVNGYVRGGDLGCARVLFDEMPVRNSVSWACLISGYTRNLMPDEACVVFREMVCAGFSLNVYAIASALRASCQVSSSGGVRLGLQIHGLVVKTPYAFDAVVCNVLISFYGNCVDSVDCAFRAFDGVRMKNLISWNCMISVCSHRGDAVSAFELLTRMQQESSEFLFKPSEYTFGSLVTAASSMDSGLCLLEQMLAKINKSGFMQDLYVGSALVNGFARFGLLDTAKKIFEQISERNAVSMNGLMVGLVGNKQGEEATKYFLEIKDLVKINSDSFVVLLSSFPDFSVLEEGRRKGREVHAQVIRTGFIDSKVEVGNGLVNMYAKCGAINDAGSVFSLMVNKDSISWNSMISGLDQNDCFENAVMSFYTMRKTGLMPSNFTLISVLNSCGSLGWINLGQQVHCEGLKLGLDLDVSVSNALLALYAETGRIIESRKVFSLMEDYDQVSWNTVIGAFADSEEYAFEAVRYFLDMMEDGWILNRVTFINIVSAVSCICHHDLGRQIHALVLKYHFIDDSAIDNVLLSFYGKCGNMHDCEIIFGKMSERRDDITWNSMISGYIHNELLPKAMDLVWCMLQRGQRLDCFTFATVLSACASVATLERGMEVHACAIRAHLESDVVIGSALVDMYSKCGRVDYASRFFELMPVKNVYSWNSMIAGFARHGHGNKALVVFEKMIQLGQLPDHVTFVGVLSACSHVGLFEQGFKYFESMKSKFSLTPRIEHFSCMVDLLGRAGELEKIEDFINKMPMNPNILIWRTVLGACSRANGRKTDLGRRAAEMLLQLEPQNAVNYVLLSNMYASGRKWHDVAKARDAMREAKVKKEAGCSWVNMKDGIHVFVAGDKSHCENEAIHEKLGELHGKMRDLGYVPQTNFALYDLELESKEELLSYHSEKLAVAFVLTRKSELPIRIMKNLRVCGDCHSAFKYISQIVGRQIILRDSNRFHHFANGRCSCGDYW